MNSIGFRKLQSLGLSTIKRWNSFVKRQFYDSIKEEIVGSFYVEMSFSLQMIAAAMASALILLLLNHYQHRSAVEIFCRLCCFFFSFV